MISQLNEKFELIRTEFLFHAKPIALGDIRAEIALCPLASMRGKTIGRLGRHLENTQSCNVLGDEISL